MFTSWLGEWAARIPTTPGEGDKKDATNGIAYRPKNSCYWARPRSAGASAHFSVLDMSSYQELRKTIPRRPGATIRTCAFVENR
jgi:hypothetical protein